MKCELKTASLFNYPLKVEDIFKYGRGSLLSFFGWGGWETARLPREKDLGKTPQRRKPEEACQVPRRKEMNA